MDCLLYWHILTSFIHIPTNPNVKIWRIPNRVLIDVAWNRIIVLVWKITLVSCWKTFNWSFSRMSIAPFSVLRNVPPFHHPVMKNRPRGRYDYDRYATLPVVHETGGLKDGSPREPWKWDWGWGDQPFTVEGSIENWKTWIWALSTTFFSDWMTLRFRGLKRKSRCILEMIGKSQNRWSGNVEISIFLHHDLSDWCHRYLWASSGSLLQDPQLEMSKNLKIGYIHKYSQKMYIHS